MLRTPSLRQASPAGTTVEIVLPSRGSEDVVLQMNATWLRDQCRCERCYQRQQKALTRVTDEAKFLTVVSESPLSISAKEDGTAYEIVWADGHESIYHIDTLREDFFLNARRIPELVNRETWFGYQLREMLPRKLDYRTLLTSKATQSEMFSRLVRYGFCEIESVPQEKHCLLEVLNLLGGTLHTGFSENEDATMELTANDSQNDLGWTNHIVPSHTDFTYITNPSRMVGMHLLQQQGTGGLFSLVDGFAIAAKMRRDQPELFHLLTKVPILWKHIRKDGVEERLIDFAIKLHPLDPEQMLQIRWNAVYMFPLSNAGGGTATLDDTPNENDIERVYAALRWLYQEIWCKKENQYIFLPRTDEITIFDNYRLIHARSTGYTGHRRMHVGDVSNDQWTLAARQFNSVF